MNASALERRETPIVEQVEIFNRLNDLPPRFRGGVLSIGKFDGLHLGHARIMSSVAAMAKRLDAPTIVFTFSPPPVNVLFPDRACAPLADVETKRALVAHAGADALVEFPTTRAFLEQTADEFFSKVVVEQLGAVGMVEGEDFSFGRNREGSEKRLEELAKRHHVELEVVPPVMVGDVVVSSSAIRRTLEEGDVALAARMLGRRYRISGRVEQGDQRGRTLGFPTANLHDPGVCLPKNALYAAIARTQDGTVRPAAVNLGGNPTFGIETRKIEAHILDFSGDIYGQPLELEFCAKLREIVRFSDKDALLAQMARDLTQTREIVESALN